MLSLLILNYLLQTISSLNCERVEIGSGDSTLIIPTQYCYSGKLSNGVVTYSSQSFEYKCINGLPYYNQFDTVSDCSGEPTTSTSMDTMGLDSYGYFCGHDKCDVVHLTLYEGVTDCSNITKVKEAAQFKGAFFVDFCNYVSGAGIMLKCGGDNAQILTYADYDSACKGEHDTQSIDTESAVDCDVTINALGVNTAVTARCELPSGSAAEKKKKTVIIIVSVVAAVVVIAVIVVAVCFYMKKKKQQSDDKYDQFLDVENK